MKNVFKLLSIFLLLGLATQAAHAGEYAVLVNTSNGASGDTKSEIKNLFLKRKTSWEGGAKSVPLARSADSPEQKAFNKAVLGMSGAELSGHWQSEKQKTGETPPKEVGSEGILYRQIKRKEGAFGVVLASSASKLPDGIKVLFKFTD